MDLARAVRRPVIGRPADQADARLELDSPGAPFGFGAQPVRNRGGGARPNRWRPAVAVTEDRTPRRL